jgi:hypothetical protein
MSQSAGSESEPATPAEPPEGMVWVPESTHHRSIYHTRRCPSVRQADTTVVPAARETLPDWRECKKCAGKCDKSDPKRECPLCGDVYVLGRHLPECDGGDGS